MLLRDSATEPTIAPDERADDGAGHERHAIACAACLQVVTRPSAACEVDGSHEHRFRNPHGIEFHLGCFTRVAGCVTIGTPTLEFTWFAGHRWAVELCGSCGTHLGWEFTAGGGGGFHGLILARLVEIEQST